VRRLLVVALLLSTLAEAKPSKKLNMPPGWTWPPSKAMKEEGRACREHLDALGIAYTTAPATRKVTTPIYLTDMSVRGLELRPMWKKGPFVMDCLLAAALADEADVFRSAGVVALRFAEIYDYRNINDGKRRILSRHALGLAIDVFAFVTDDDVVHPVLSDYPDAFFLTLEDWLRGTNAYRLLTPGNDRKHHRDHFHFEVRMPGERPIPSVAAAPSPRKS